ncbi:MAG: ATP-binding protein [Treponemataceae bacterium]|nr:ATP-binding protein [Treponemataceae bacterium]
MDKKMDIMAKLSHEVRTPLNSIIGLNRIISDNLNDSCIVEDCSKKIAVASDYLLAIVNNLLDMEQFASGKVSLNETDFSLAHLLSFLSVVFEESAKKDGIAFEFSSVDLPEFVYGDKERLRRVLSNLLSNAIRYNKKNGHVDFVVENLRIVDGAYKIRFTIADDGIGMSEEKLKNIFVPYSSVDTTDSDAIYGMGVGLSVANNIVKEMGGTINVSSAEGTGSTFWFEIPLKISETFDKVEESNKKKELEGKTILIAEDDAINCTIVRHLLENFGCKVEVTTNGKDALALFSASEPNHYDAILLDIRMPEMDGLETCRKIRALGGEDSCVYEALEIPIIAMTANVMDSDVEKSMEAGMNAHLSKPIDPDELYTVLAASIRR